MIFMRLDQYLVHIGKIRSRSQAKDFIQNGQVQVFVNEAWQTILKPNFRCSENTEIQILQSEDLEWVARSGRKLEGALVRLGKDVKGLVCLDVGQSTGGFTQALLRRSAAKVVGVDVGTDQLSSEVREHPDVLCYESTDARDLLFLKEDWVFNFVVVDVSFISALKVLPSIKQLRFEKAEALILVKPQFEVGKSLVGRSGLVESPKLLLDCQKQVFDALKEMSLEVLDYFPSEVKGKNGNQEFFCYIQF